MSRRFEHQLRGRVKNAAKAMAEIRPAWLRRIFCWPGPPKGPAGFETAACGRVTTAKAPRMRLRGPTRAKEATRIRCPFPSRPNYCLRQMRNRLICAKLLNSCRRWRPVRWSRRSLVERSAARLRSSPPLAPEFGGGPGARCIHRSQPPGHFPRYWQALPGDAGLPRYARRASGSDRCHVLSLRWPKT